MMGSAEFARARRRAFWRGFRDGITGGPLRRWLARVTLLGAFNFLVLQWFGVRLCCGYDPGGIPGRRSGPISDAEVVALGGRWWSRYAPPRGVRIRWHFLRWIWPLTGWWSEYRWIAGGRAAAARMARR